MRISAYVSRLLGELLVQTKSDDAFGRLVFDGVVLFVDIVDSSAIVERFAGTGPAGAERLGGALSSYFSSVFDVIEAYGGDVIRIHGDAVLALWRGGDVHAAAARAARAAFALRDAPEVDHTADGFLLRHRLVLSAGGLDAVSFAGSGDARFFVLAGPAIESLASAPRSSRPGDIVVTPAAAALLVQAGCVRQSSPGAWLLESLPSDAATPQVTQDRPWGSGSEAIARQFIPRMVADRLDLGRAAWLAEFRVLSMIYVNLTDLDAGAHAAERIRDAVGLIQSGIEPFGLALFDVSMGDKGVVAQVACGLPPFAQENSTLRALEAARKVHGALHAAGVPCSIGVASGRAFCGDVGNSTRRECLITGPVMHVAARLMQAAACGILCDDETAKAAADHFELAEPALLAVKGVAEPLTVYRADLLRRTQRGIIEAENTLYGRDDEVRQFVNRFDDLQRGGRAVLAIEAELGAGKSRLLAHVAAEARLRGFGVVGAATSSVELTTAYYACRSLVQQLLLAPNDPPSPAAALLRERLVEALSDDPLQAKAALINDVLPLGVEDDGLAAEISGPARLAGIEDLFVKLASRRAAAAPLVLLIDDLHWLDDPSARLLLAVARRVPRVLVTTATRPLDMAAGPHVRRLSESATLRLCLTRLSRTAIVAMVCELLRVRSVPPRLGDFVYATSEGLPFHAEQLVLSLCDQGMIAVSEGRCRVTAELSPMVVPDNLRDLIVSRIDRLDPAHQVTAKVASAIGRTFDVEVLTHLFPFARELPKIRDILRDLVGAGILDVRLGADSAVCAFRHVLVQEATYELLTFEQRQPLHRRIAEFIEQRHRSDLAPHYAPLADHCERAGEFERAIAYRQQAALLAIRRYANHDALSHVEKIDRLAARVPLTLARSQAAELAHIRADACHELSRFGEAQEHFKLCASLNGIPVPASRGRLILSVAAESGRQVLHRLGLTRATSDAHAQQQDRLAAHIHTRFAEHAYFTGDALRLVHGTLTSLNRAERVGALAEIIEGYGGLAIGLGAAGFRRMATFYRDRSIACAVAEGRLHDQGFAHLLAAVYSFSAGEWDATRTHCTQGAAICQHIGDRFRYQSCRVVHAYLHIVFGECGAAEEVLRALGEDADEVENIPVRAWVLVGRAIIDLLLGREPALALARIASARDDSLHRAERLLCDGVAAVAYLQAGDMPCAVRAADDALTNMMENAPTMGIALLSVAGAAEVHVAAAERAAATGSPCARLLRRAATACRVAGIYAAKTPICRPRTLLLNGRLAILRKRPRRARRHWEDALKDASRLGMPLEQALCHLALATVVGPAQEEQHLHAADTLLGRVGAKPWSYSGCSPTPDCRDTESRLDLVRADITSTLEGEL